MTSQASTTLVFRRRSLRIVLAALTLLALHPVLHAQETVFELDPAQTKIEFTLGASLHTVHGSFKLKSGTIRINLSTGPSTGAAGGAIVIDASSGESGNSNRDKRMHREILESDKFPEIRFTPRQVKGALSSEGPSKLEVSGQVRLHGEDHEVTLPIDVITSGQEIRLTTQTVIPYVQWGLKNPSTFILRVSDRVTIDIHATGRTRNAAAALRTLP